jgi:hypothetical protein
MKTLATIAAGLFAAMGALAQVPKTAPQLSDTDAMALLLGSCVVPRAIINVTAEECTSRYPDLEVAALDAIMEWEARFAPYEKQAIAVAATYAARLEKTLGKAKVDELEATTRATKQTSASGAARGLFKRTFETTPMGRHKIVCVEFLQGVNEGRMDFTATQRTAWGLIQAAK